MVTHARTHPFTLQAAFQDCGACLFFSLLTPEPLLSTSQPAGSDRNMAEPRCKNTFTRERFGTSNQLPYIQVELARWPRNVRYTTYNEIKFNAHEPYKNYRTISSNRRTNFFARTHSQIRRTLPTTPPRGLIIFRGQLLVPTPQSPLLYQHACVRRQRDIEWQLTHSAGRWLTKHCSG